MIGCGARSLPKLRDPLIAMNSASPASISATAGFQSLF
jgi:hypothetical protein